MEAHVHPRMADGVAVLEVAGELDLYTSPKLKTALDTVLTEGHVRLIVDLLAATYLDSTALSILSSALQRARDAGGNLGVIYNQPQIDRMFTLTGLKEIFPIFSSEEEALAAARSWSTVPRGV